MKRKSLRTAATFGAAMTAMYAAPELHADIVSIGFNPGSFAFQTVTSVSTNVAMTNTANASDIGSFSQWNDAIGKTAIFNNLGLQSWGSVTSGNSLSTAGFTGNTSNITFSASASGTAYIGFRSLAGNVGWFSINLNDGSNAVVWGPGQYGTAGETVIVGSTPVPEPTGLGLLALGAIGIGARRRRRKSPASEIV